MCRKFSGSLFLVTVVLTSISCNVLTASSNQSINSKSPTLTNSRSGSTSGVSKGTDVPKVRDDLRLPGEFLGRWGGTGGGLIDITEKELHDLLEDQAYSYTVDESKQTANGTVFILKLENLSKKSFLKPLVVITFKDSTHFIYYGYDSYEKYLKNEFAGAGEFFKNGS